MIVGLDLVIPAWCADKIRWTCSGHNSGRLRSFIAHCDAADMHVLEISLHRAADGAVLQALDPRAVCPATKFERATSIADWIIEEGDEIELAVFNRDDEEERWFHGALDIEPLSSTELLWWADVETGVLVQPTTMKIEPGTRHWLRPLVVVDPHTYEGFS